MATFKSLVAPYNGGNTSFIHNAAQPHLFKLSNGYLVIFYWNPTDQKYYYKISKDIGITWEAGIQINNSGWDGTSSSYPSIAVAQSGDNFFGAFQVKNVSNTICGVFKAAWNGSSFTLSYTTNSASDLNTMGIAVAIDTTYNIFYVTHGRVASDANRYKWLNGYDFNLGMQISNQLSTTGFNHLSVHMIYSNSQLLIVYQDGGQSSNGNEVRLIRCDPTSASAPNIYIESVAYTYGDSGFFSPIVFRDGSTMNVSIVSTRNGDGTHWIRRTGSNTYTYNGTIDSFSEINVCGGKASIHQNAARTLTTFTFPIAGEVYQRTFTSDVWSNRISRLVDIPDYVYAISMFPLSTTSEDALVVLQNGLYNVDLKRILPKAKKKKSSKAYMLVSNSMQSPGYRG